MLFFIPISLIWWFAGDLVCALGLESEELFNELDELPQNPDIKLVIAHTVDALVSNATSTSTATPLTPHSALLCSKASEFSQLSLIWLWPAVFYNILVSALEAVEIVVPQTVITVAFVGVNVFINWLFVVQFDWFVNLSTDCLLFSAHAILSGDCSDRRSPLLCQNCCNCLCCGLFAAYGCARRTVCGPVGHANVFAGVACGPISKLACR